MNPTIAFLKQRFSDYYKGAELYMPDRFGRREWGFMFLGESFMQRHKAFKNMNGLKRFLVQKVPAHVYHSSAYYKNPGASTMDEKEWLGADLIFDLDADHIKGAENMTYEETLRKVKEEFIRLIDDYLLSDFGFHEEQLTIVFSGGRGYHIHLRDPRVLELTSHERREIVDYITGKNLDMEDIFPREAYDKSQYGSHISVKQKVLMPEKGVGGWKGKMREGILALTYELEELSEEEAVKRLFAFEGVGEKTAKGIYKDLFDGKPGSRGLDRMRDEEILEVFSSDKHRNMFLRIVQGEISIKMKGDKDKVNIGELEGFNVKEDKKGETDEPVTSDIKRLIRLPTSLHGKTGLKVLPLTRGELDDFDPFRDAVPERFSDEPINIEVQKPINIGLKGENFSLKEGLTEVPEFAAVFLMCRRHAVLPTGE